MANRITGMYSGLDTEGLIQDLMKARRKKNEKTVKNQTKLEWKQEKWKDLNTKLNKLMSKTVSSLRWSTSFQKKTAVSSNPNAVSVIAGEGAMNSVQSLSVKRLASTGYLTGDVLKSTSDEKITSSTKMSELSFKGASISGSGSFDVTVGDKTTTINIDADTTISGVVSKLTGAGINASFDEKNQRIFIGAKTSGEKADFTITANDANGNMALSSLGINTGVSAGASAIYSETKSYESSLVYDGEGNFDAAATVAKLQASPDSEAYKKFMAMAKSNYSSKISATQSEHDTLASDIEKLKADIEKLKVDKDNEILTPDDIAIIETNLAEKEALLAEKEPLLAEKKTALDEMKVNLDAGVYDIESMEAAAVSLKNKVEFANSVSAGGDSMVNTGAVRLTGSDAEIELNGAKFTSDNNSFSVNGLTITCSSLAENVTITTQEDTNGIYDMVKNFIKEYNSIINEMDSLYNAASTKVEPLTDEERDAVSEKEAEKLENQVKDSLFRRDETLGGIFNGLREVMSSGFTIGEKTMYLSDFGISTGGYFTTAEGERNAFHIDGDADDTVTSGNADKLKTMIATDSETVVDFFTQLGKSLYDKMQKLSASSDYSSFGSFYDDKKIKTDLSDFKSKIAKEEEDLAAYEDKYYAKFAAMEVALSKMESKNSYLSGLFTK